MKKLTNRLICITLLAVFTASILAACSTGGGYVFFVNWSNHESAVYSVTIYSHNGDTKTAVAEGELTYTVESNEDTITLSQNSSITHNSVIPYNAGKVDTFESETVMIGTTRSNLLPISVSKKITVNSLPYEGSPNDRSYEYSASYEDGLKGSFTRFDGTGETSTGEWDLSKKQLNKLSSVPFDNEQLFFLIRATETSAFIAGATFNYGIINLAQAAFDGSVSGTSVTATIAEDLVNIAAAETLPEGFALVTDGFISCYQVGLTFPSGPAIQTYYSSRALSPTQILVKVVQTEFNIPELTVGYTTEYVLKGFTKS